MTRLQKETSMAKRQYDQLEKTVRRQDQNRADVEGQVQNLRGQLKVCMRLFDTEEWEEKRVSISVNLCFWNLNRHGSYIHYLFFLIIFYHII